MSDYTISITIEDSKLLMKLLGQYDENVKIMEESMNVNLVSRDGALKIIGDKENVELAERAINTMVETIKESGQIDTQKVNYIMELAKKEHEDDYDKLSDIICYSYKGKQIRSKTLGQKRYVDAIANNEVVFGIGPAGTGKTYLAMAMAIKAFKREEVSRIILTRPAIEAGESLGFLPGDLQEKVDPYLRPLYDALYDLIGAEAYLRYREKGLIEVAPLAYMRGRTLDDSFIILDEAQNTTPEQMKMFLTRMGFGSKVIITGDITQVDLPGSKVSGLTRAERVLAGVKGIEFVYLTKDDVVRHHLVQAIIEAYERYEAKLTGNK